MPLKKKQNLIYFILSLSLFVSLYFQENSSGGSKLDNILTKHFIDYFQISLSEGLNYFIKTGQVHSPVFYIIVAKTKLLFGNHLSSIIYVIISATLPFLFYNLLKKKFIHANKEYLFFLSLLIFLSPYFRSSASWFTNDNLAIILFCLSLKYFLKIKNNKDSITKNFFLCFIFLSLAAYIRQYYGIFIVIYIIELIKKKNLTLIINCILLNLVLSLPLLYYSYYLYIENNLYFNSSNPIDVNIIDNIIFVFSIIFIYLFPFFVSIKLNFQNIKNYILKNIKLILLVSIIVFFIIFWHSFGSLEYGGGAIYKLTKNFTSYQNFAFGFIFGITSLFLLTLFEKKFINYVVIFLLCSISFDFVFQKYYDPLILITFLLLIESKKLTNLINGKMFKINIVYLFFLLFLFGTNIYYYN